jgi:hypothetical protein
MVQQSPTSWLCLWVFSFGQNLARFVRHVVQPPASALIRSHCWRVLRVALLVLHACIESTALFQQLQSAAHTLCPPTPPPVGGMRMPELRTLLCGVASSNPSNCLFHSLYQLALAGLLVLPCNPMHARACVHSYVASCLHMRSRSRLGCHAMQMHSCVRHMLGSAHGMRGHYSLVAPSIDGQSFQSRCCLLSRFSVCRSAHVSCSRAMRQFCRSIAWYPCWFIHTCHHAQGAHAHFAVVAALCPGAAVVLPYATSCFALNRSDSSRGKGCCQCPTEQTVYERLKRCWGAISSSCVHASAGAVRVCCTAAGA